MTKRRNPFETSQSALPTTPPVSIYDSLCVPSPRKRSRQWEKKHQSQKAVYRGVDPKLALKVKSIAGDLLVPEGEVAHAVIEYALHAYGQGDLDLHPRSNPYRMRMTLFSDSNSACSVERSVRISRRKQPESHWRVITTWRSFPPELKKELASLASDDGLNVPLGELVTTLLRFGLKAYDKGLLNLQPDQKATTHPSAKDDTR